MQAVLIYNLDPAWDAVERHEAERESRRLGYAIRRRGRSVTLSPIQSADVADALTAFDPTNTIVLNWCEGLPGIDRSEPRVARILEELNFTYTGAPAEVIELSYDKPRVKALLRDAGIPTPDWTVAERDDIHALAAWTCYPAIVKPACEHCSIGMDSRSVVTDAAGLREQVRRIHAELEQPALIEDFIDGREFHVSLWGNRVVDMLPPVEMDFSALPRINDRVCSFDAKFSPGSQAYRDIATIVPARLSDVEHAELADACRRAYRVVGCRDYGRIDARMRDGVFYVLDVNPNADISADASMAVAAGKVGMCYGALGERILELAARRHREK